MCGMKKRGREEMKRYLNYLKYVMKHKYFVFVAAWKIQPSIHLMYRALVHDLSKFKPSEFIPSAKTFYAPDGSKQYNETVEFNQAWNDHQKRNKHHWQYFMLKMDRGDIKCMSMPTIYLLEMLADWLGAGRCINGSWDYTIKWYDINKDNMQLNKDSRFILEAYIEEIRSKHSCQ